VRSLLVIAQRNPIYSVLLLIASFGALSGLYVLLDAPFAAVDPDHRLRRRDHGAVPVRGHAAERAARGHRARSARASADARRPMGFGVVLALVLVAELAWRSRGREPAPFAAVDQLGGGDRPIAVHRVRSSRSR
jgi:hypothetical protein